MKLTRTAVLEIPVPEEGKTWIADDTLSGLYLVVSSGGKRSWALRYTIGRTRKLFVFGNAAIIMPDDARKHAAAMLVQVALGKDPSDEKKQRREAATVAELFVDYFAKHAVKKKPKSVAEDRITYRAHIAPRFDHMAARDVKRSHVDNMMSDLADRPTMANRTRALLSKAFSLAEEWDIIPVTTNPCRFADKNREKARERLLTPDELAKLGAALTKLSDTLPWEAIAIVRLALYTGLRQGEIMRMRWEWIDDHQKQIRVPDPKQGGTSIATLIPEAEDLLRSIPRRDALGPIFPWVLFPKKYWETIREASGIKDLHFHDLRHVFGSYAARAGGSQRLIAKLLNHKQLATTERYVNALDQDRIDLTRKTGATIAGMLDAGKTKKFEIRKKTPAETVAAPDPFEGLTPEQVAAMRAMIAAMKKT